MRCGNDLRLLCGLSLLSSSIYAQCYDLTSVQLYELKGRFQERWDKPIWNAKPGEGNFQIDEPGHGGIDDFIIFTIGQVRKTDAGWVPLQKSRMPEHWCEILPERSSLGLCFTPPYETPSPKARPIKPTEYDREMWSLGQDGLLRYTRRTHGESAFDHTRNLGSTFEAVLDLNTGAYSTEDHRHSKGHYTKRITGGVELWRDTTLSARVKLIPQPCSASVQRASLKSGEKTLGKEAHPVPICAVRAKEGSQPSFEFIMNPKSLSSPEGCIVAHEGPMPSSGVSVAKAIDH